MFLKIILSVVMLTFVTSSTAQAQAQQPRPEVVEQMQQLKVSDKTMKRFVEVEQKVRKIQEDYHSQAESVDNTTKEKLAEQANKKILKSVEESPITVNEYSQIAQALPYNNKLQQQYQKFLR